MAFVFAATLCWKPTTSVLSTFQVSPTLIKVLALLMRFANSEVGKPKSTSSSFSGIVNEKLFNSGGVDSKYFASLPPRTSTAVYFADISRHS